MTDFASSKLEPSSADSSVESVESVESSEDAAQPALTQQTAAKTLQSRNL